MCDATLITKRDYRLLAAWVIALFLCYAVVCVVGVRMLRGYKEETAKKRAAWLQSAAMDRQTVERDQEPASATGPIDVHVGILVNGITGFQLRESSWSADFDIWFRWTGDGISPGETFRIGDGDLGLREKTAAEIRGDQHYERYHVQARIRKVFDPSRFPFATEALGIQVEDSALEGRAVRYVTDDASCRIDRTGVPSVVRLVQTLSTVRIATPPYDGYYDDASGGGGVFQPRVRFVYVMLVAPIAGTKYLSMFQALFAAIAIGLLVFLIKPTHVDPRFGLGVGGFFAAVGNNILLMSELPTVDRLTLVGMINGVGLMTLFLTLIQSTASLHIYDSLGRERLSRVFDLLSLAVVLPCYVIVNVVLPRAAAM
jgi:hypothetical protein